MHYSVAAASQRQAGPGDDHQAPGSAQADALDRGAGRGVAEALDIQHGDDLFHVLLVHYEDGVPIQVEDRYVVPDFAPEFLDQVAEAPPGIVAAGFISTFTLFGLGWLLFGAASLRARVVPAIPVWLLMIGAILGLVSRIAGLGVPGVLFGVALAWLGWWLCRVTIGRWSSAGDRERDSRNQQEQRE